MRTLLASTPCHIGVVILLTLAAVLSHVPPAQAQTIEPVIVEYQQKASGRIDIVNDSLTPMAVVLEPKSFSISEDGHGIYRALDPGIHLKLSTTSFMVGPKQTYYVFYKATSDKLPAWFTVYAEFSLPGPSTGLKVRFMLPHTVYLYQKMPIGKDAIHVANATFQVDQNQIVCDIRNDGPGLIRVQDVRALGGKSEVQNGGFPLLPGTSRHLAIEWKEHSAPDLLVLRFPHFEVKESVSPLGP